MGRFTVCPKTGLKRGAWTPEEDGLLSAYIMRYGHWNWREIPKYAGLSRCGKSCRLRWMNYLRPNIKRGNYTREEEELIINLHEKFGKRWSAIAASLPGRTDNEIKNHWHTHLKKRTKQNTTSTKAKRKPVGCETLRLKESANCYQAISRPLILESSGFLPMSPEKSCDIPSSSADSEVEIIQKQVTYESPISSSDAVSDFSGSFWTDEPFLLEDILNMSEDVTSVLVDPSFQFPLSPLGRDIYPYDLYHDYDMDIFFNH
ncbi:hypothetical protein AQUCO_03000245v1 [Aquilegia coerulea]|uniref:Uncharacterized protein n=1 Tax=Aquilegia coerulea TaxID=218851 RepID=A0A2G5D1Z2_AQUCA|nr:hypothetical protein AQUCO_03000245v1 [Aquilegia coerulea]